MREITILSGKGGTGKTSIAAALGSIAKATVFCDCDVDAADLHLIFHPDIKEKHTFFSSFLMTIDQDICSLCNTCVENCRFDAIHPNNTGGLSINPFQCESCRLCERVCPAQAISSERKNNNFWFVSKTRFGTMVHAKMGAGEENSGKLVTQVRSRAKEIALESQSKFIINDGPPGIGCATISSLSGTNTVLIVIEPTKSGLHDAKRLVELIRSFNIEAYAIINKYDINKDASLTIEDYLKAVDIPLIARLPFDKEMVEAMIHEKTIIEYNPNSEISKKIIMAWETLVK